MLAVMEEYS